MRFLRPLALLLAFADKPDDPAIEAPRDGDAHTDSDSDAGANDPC